MQRMLLSLYNNFNKNSATKKKSVSKILICQKVPISKEQGRLEELLKERLQNRVFSSL